MKWFRSSGKTEDNEKEHLTRYDKQQKPKQKKNTPEEKKSLKKEPETLSTKLEFAKQEYSVTIGNLMNAKKELKNVKETIQELNNEYDSIVSRTKSSREELLKVNNELKEKSVESEKSVDVHEEQGLIVQEVNNSKMELSKIKDEIKKYGDELESVRTKTDNSPDVKKMKEDREDIENEIIQKRKELESGFKELKFIKDEISKSNKSEGSDKIVDAASAVVASMNRKLQTTLTELNAVKKALENERGRQKSSA
jgi:chromosome segregation ATPase